MILGQLGEDEEVDDGGLVPTEEESVDAIGDGDGDGVGEDEEAHSHGGKGSQARERRDGRRGRE